MTENSQQGDKIQKLQTRSCEEEQRCQRQGEAIFEWKLYSESTKDVAKELVTYVLALGREKLGYVVLADDFREQVDRLKVSCDLKFCSPDHLIDV